jgi:hypothetical protein
VADGRIAGIGACAGDYSQRMVNAALPPPPYPGVSVRARKCPATMRRNPSFPCCALFSQSGPAFEPIMQILVKMRHVEFDENTRLICAESAEKAASRSNLVFNAVR